MFSRIGIIGDVHAQHNRLQAGLEWLESLSVDAIVCTGDIADGCGDIDIACQLLKQYQVVTVRGNHDRWLLDDRVRHVEHAHFRDQVSSTTEAFLESLPITSRIPTVSGDLLLCHGVLENDLGKIWPGSQNTQPMRSADLDCLLADPCSSPRYLVNGHMHFRTLVDFPSCQIINAGTLKGKFPGVTLLDAANQTLVSYDCIPTCASSDAATYAFLQAQTFALKPGHERRVWTDSAAFDGIWEPVTLHCRKATA